MRKNTVKSVGSSESNINLDYSTIVSIIADSIAQGFTYSSTPKYSQSVTSPILVHRVLNDEEAFEEILEYLISLNEREFDPIDIAEILYLPFEQVSRILALLRDKGGVQRNE
jgi:CRP-like cAMP-binding protein